MVRSLPLAVLSLCLASAAGAAPGVEPPTGASDLVVRFSEGFGEGAPGARTVIEVWGDGRVVVQRPEFVSGSRRAQAALSPGQVRSLLQQIAGHGVFEFDPPAVRASLKAEDRARAEQARSQPGRPMLTHVSDPDPTTLEVHAARYVPDDGPPVENAARVIDWAGVAGDAARHPDHAAIAGLRDAQDAVRGLLALPGLR